MESALQVKLSKGDAFSCTEEFLMATYMLCCQHFKSRKRGEILHLEAGKTDEL